MTGDALLVFVILGATIALFVSDRLRLDLVAVMSLLALALSGILTPAEALAGFSDPVVVMIAALFVVGGALFRTGLAERAGHAIGAAAGTSRAALTAMLMVAAGVLSAFLSSTGTVAVLLPVAATLAWGARLSPSLLLIPLAVGSSLGGLVTLIGTPPNLVVSNALVSAGHEGFAFFDFTLVGLASLAVGMGVLVAFGGRLLPSRASADGPAHGDVVEIEGSELLSEYALGEVTRARVGPDSPLVGVSPAGADLRRAFGVNVLGIRRRGPAGRRRLSSTAVRDIEAGDELELQGAPDAIARLAEEKGLTLAGTRPAPDAQLAEVLLTPRSRLIGKTLAEWGFRERYGANVLSVGRKGRPLPDVATTPLRFADSLLVAATPRRIERLRDEAADLVVVARAKERLAEGPLAPKQIAALAVAGAMMLVLTLDLVPPAVAVLAAAVAMVLTRALDVEAAYRSINWESVVLIASILPMATALDKTGGMDLIVGQMSRVGAFGPLALMAAVFAVTGLLSQVMSNTATAVLIAPVAVGAAATLGVSPEPFLMAVAVAASSAFATPVASPITMLVLGPGGYRFADFFRTGLLIQLVLLVVMLVLIPLLFPF